MAASAIIGSGVLAAGTTIWAANKAAGVQGDAAKSASQTSRDMFDITQKNLSPFMQGGTNAFNQLGARMPFLTSPIKMDQASLEQTPGYQFTLSQGLKSVQNSAAARGLGTSGAAYKGAAEYATGLADKTYMDQFNLENTNRTNEYNRLLGTSTLGANAAAGIGTAAQDTGKTIGANTIGAANALGASYMADANAVGKAGNNIASYYWMNQFAPSMYSTPAAAGPGTAASNTAAAKGP